MNANEIALLAKSTLDGSIPFPEIVGKLISNGVEYYHVDYATSSFTFYSASGAAVIAPITIENLPPIAEGFDVAALKAAILDSQQHGQKFRDFCGRAIRAGVQGYIAYLRGKRVTYFFLQLIHSLRWPFRPAASTGRSQRCGPERGRQAPLSCDVGVAMCTDPALFGRMKVCSELTLPQADDWVEISGRGRHRPLKHPTKET